MSNLIIQCLRLLAKMRHMRTFFVQNAGVKLQELSRSLASRESREFGIFRALLDWVLIPIGKKLSTQSLCSAPWFISGPSGFLLGNYAGRAKRERRSMEVPRQTSGYSTSMHRHTVAGDWGWRVLGQPNPKSRNYSTDLAFRPSVRPSVRQVRFQLASRSWLARGRP